MYLHAIEDNRHSDEIKDFINQLYKRMTYFQDLMKFRHPCYDWMKQKENATFIQNCVCHMASAQMIIG